MASKTFSELYTDALIQCDEVTGSGSATAKIIVKSGINESYAEIAAVRDWETLENNTHYISGAGNNGICPCYCPQPVFAEFAGRRIL